MFKFNIQTFLTTFLTLLLCIPLVVSAQKEGDKLSEKLQTRLLNTKSNQTVTLFIYFKDKGDNLEEKLLKERAELSPHSLHRRIINRGADNVVGFNDIPINSDYLNLIKPQVAKIRHKLKALNAVSVEATPPAVANLAKYNFVQKIELVNKLKRRPDPQTREAFPKASIDDTTKQIISALALDYGASFVQNNQINVPAVHDLGYSGNGVVIAIFDTGFNRLSHEVFNQLDIAGTWDFVNDDSDVGDSSDMGTGSHGTNTLSTIGGFSSGNLIGPAYGATYYLAKTENTVSELHVEEDNWCAAAEWADTNGAQIITSSLGYTGFDAGVDYTPEDLDGDTTVVTICADLAAENGIVVINSAGNSGPGVTTLGAPSDGNFVLAVGAVTAQGNLSSFSSVGPSADGRIKPDVMAMGTGVLVASSSSDTGYFNVDGTSFSCPLTAGVAALVLESNNNLTAAQVRDILRNSADQASTPNNSFGYGILNALTAVEAAIDGVGGSFAPNASFAVITEELVINLISTSTDSDGSIVSHAWDFGDANLSSEESPSHTYATAGTYTVALTVTDNDDLNEDVSRTITVISSVVPPPIDTPSPDPEPSRSGGGGSGNIVFIIAVGLLLLTRRGLGVFGSSFLN